MIFPKIKRFFVLDIFSDFFPGISPRKKYLRVRRNIKFEEKQVIFQRKEKRFLRLINKELGVEDPEEYEYSKNLNYN